MKDTATHVPRRRHSTSPTTHRAGVQDAGHRLGQDPGVVALTLPHPTAPSRMYLPRPRPGGQTGRQAVGRPAEQAGPIALCFVCGRGKCVRVRLPLPPNCCASKLATSDPYAHGGRSRGRGREGHCPSAPFALGLGATEAGGPQTDSGRLGGWQRGRFIRAVVVARGQALGRGRAFQLGTTAVSEVSSGAGGSG